MMITEVIIISLKQTDAMKKILKIAGITLASIVGLALIAVVVAVIAHGHDGVHDVLMTVDRMIHVSRGNPQFK